MYIHPIVKHNIYMRLPWVKKQDYFVFGFLSIFSERSGQGCPSYVGELNNPG